MTETTTPSDRRASSFALLGLVWQVLAWAILLVVGLKFESAAAIAVSRFLAVGIPIWLVLVLVFKQIRRVASETLETAELHRAQEAGQSSALFEVGDEALLLERNKLAWMVRWFFPTITILLAIYLLGGQFLWWDWSLGSAFTEEGPSLTQEASLGMWIAIGTAFLCYLCAKTMLGFTRSVPQWQLLSAGASCLAGGAWICALFGLSLAATSVMGVAWAEPLFAFIVRVVLLVLGLEFALNLILDIYRPRVSGDVPRPPFDSRLLGLAAEPWDIAKSIAEAFNYQFGFEVSSTWFYKLLQRWLFPITVLAFIVVMALTGVVIVDADEEVVVERWGRLVTKPGATLKPGISFKWPFPQDVAYRVPVRRIGEVVIGEAQEEDDDSLDKAVVWTEAHDYVPEMLLLVAATGPASG